MDAGRAAGSPYSALHPPAGCRARPFTRDGGGLLPHRFTRSPALTGVVCFLWPCWSARGAQPGLSPAGGPWVPGLSSAPVTGAAVVWCLAVIGHWPVFARRGVFSRYPQSYPQAGGRVCQVFSILLLRYPIRSHRVPMSPKYNMGDPKRKVLLFCFEGRAGGRGTGGRAELKDVGNIGRPGAQTRERAGTNDCLFIILPERG